MKKDVSKRGYIQWHPMFVKSIKVALKDARPGQIEVLPEVPLSSEPLAMDVLVIKTRDDYKLRHPVAQLFRQYNVIVYKSPDDYLSLDAFDKALVYTRLHHVLEESKVDLWSQYTLTCVSIHYPRVLFQHLQKRGLVVEEHSPATGIYQIIGESYPVQVLVLDALDEVEANWPF